MEKVFDDDGEEIKPDDQASEINTPENRIAKARRDLGRATMSQTVGGFSEICTFDSGYIRIVITPDPDHASSLTNVHTSEI